MKAFQLLKNIFIKNASGVLINPVTNEKLDEVITAIEAGVGLQTDKSKTLKVQLDPLLHQLH